MDYSLGGAFAHKEIKDARILVREASFFLGSLKTAMRIRLYVTPDDESAIRYEASHYLQTPTSSEHRSSGASFAYSEAEAFEEAISELTDAYEMAVMAGHRPNEEWLIPNTFF